MPGFAANNDSGCSSHKAIFKKRGHLFKKNLANCTCTWKKKSIKYFDGAFLGALQFLHLGHSAKLLLL